MLQGEREPGPEVAVADLAEDNGPPDWSETRRPGGDAVICSTRASTTAGAA